MLKVHYQSHKTLMMGICGAQFLPQGQRTTVALYVSCKKCEAKLLKMLEARP